MAIGIYSITNLLNGKVYVGQSKDIGMRWKRHQSGIDKHMVISKAMAKHGAKSFSFSILEECPTSRLNEREMYWIAKFGCLAPDGYNCTSGGKAATRCSLDTRQRMSMAQKGRVITDEARKKIAKALLGTKHGADSSAKKSEALKKSWNDPLVRERRVSAMFGRKVAIETRQAIAKTNTGKKRTAETRKALSVSHGCNGVVRSDGVVFDSVSDAARAVGGATTNISKAISGKRKSAYGFTYEFI